MNKIEKLINKLCPEGVEFKKLGEVCNIKTGQAVNKIMIQKNPGDFPVINSGRKPLGFIDKFNTKNDPIGITSRGAGVGFVTWCEGKYFRGNLNYSVSIINKNLISTRFLYYLLINNRIGIQKLASYDGIPALNASKLKTFKIPIPPLPIQGEIVKILDNFTDLEAELEAELEARKKQYAYYREGLLTFGDDIKWKSIQKLLNEKNIVTVSPPKKLLKKHYNKTGEFPIVDQGQNFIVGYTDNKDAILEKDLYIIFGDHTEVIKYINFAFVQGADGIKIMKTNGLNAKYLYYSLKNFYKKTGMYTRHFSFLKKIKIPIPSIEKQKEIVKILDKFDDLVSSILIGLPAELKARKQQYEYYREKLLTFKEKL